MASAYAIDGAIQKNAWNGCWKSRKVITLVTLDEGMGDIIKIIKPPENTGVLIDGISETVKHKIKKRGWISWYVIRNFGCLKVRKYLN